jgi:hypothetical protein
VTDDHVARDLSPIPGYAQLRCVVPEHEGRPCWVTGTGIGLTCTSMLVTPSPYIHDPTRHLDNVPWYDAPAPPRRHRHWAQTKGVVSEREVWRCPCGAFGGPQETWMLLDAPRVRPSFWTRLRRQHG